MGVLAVVCGVAGSGKSSLMEVFRKQLETEAEDDLNRKPIYISQKNIGVSLRSTPATYMDVAGDIRKTFAKANKTKEDYFSFNGKGACPACGGKGVIVSEMAFMENIETQCEVCHGLRYSSEALAYKFQGKNIAEVMDMSVADASNFFADTSLYPQITEKIRAKLKPLIDVGLPYLHLNQALSTLSGGELQRMKLASYLGEKSKVFIIDEPTDGLHIKDIRHILHLFNDMVAKGNTVYIIEHNLDVIKSADYIVELGPGAGEQGGNVIFTGTPSQLAKSTNSVTAAYI